MSLGELTRSIARYPTSAILYRTRSELYLKKGLSFLAIADWDEAIRHEPENATNYLRRGMAYCIEGHFDRGLADIERGFSFASDNATQTLAYRTRGSAYLYRSDFALALADFDRVIEIEPDELDHRLRRARCLFGLRAYARAVDDLKLVVDADPSHANLWAMGSSLFGKGDYAQAESFYDRAIALKPDDREYVADRCLARLAQGKAELAISEINPLVAQDPRFSFGFTVRGWAYLIKHDLSNAMADFDRAVNLSAPGLCLFANWNLVKPDLDAHPVWDRPLAIYSRRSPNRPDLYGVIIHIKGSNARTQEWKAPHHVAYFVTRPISNGRSFILSLAMLTRFRQESKSAATGRLMAAILQGDGKRALGSLRRALISVGEENAPGSYRLNLADLIRDVLPGD